MRPIRTIDPMKNLLLSGVAFLAVSLLGGCAQHKDTAPAPTGLLCPVCVMSGEPVDPAVTSAYAGGKVGFCCEKCQGKWDKLSDADKKATLAKATSAKK